MAADPRQYGDSFADIYDDWYETLDPVDQIVSALVALAPGPRLIELGVGTGRIALPLQAAGFDVVGVDASLVMLEQITAKPTGLRGSPLSIAADMSRLPIRSARFDVALIAYNTLFNLVDDGAQHRCLSQVADGLVVGGRLVIDAYVPGPNPTTRRHGVSRARRSDDQIVLIATRQDGRSSQVDGTHLQFTRHGLTVRPWSILTHTPAELDAIAKSSGLDLEQRWTGWDREPFAPPAGRHVSVYVKS